MSDWRPREHDNLVEPLLGGLAPREREAPPPPCERDGWLWAWLAAGALSVLARAWLLAA